MRGEDVDSGVSLGTELLAFADAVMDRDSKTVSESRDTVESKLGSQGVVEAAAVIAMFNIVDRIADATGIPIDPGFTRDFRYEIGSELGMDHLTPEERAAR